MAEGSDGVFFCRPDFSHQGKEKWTLKGDPEPDRLKGDLSKPAPNPIVY